MTLEEEFESLNPTQSERATFAYNYFLLMFNCTHSAANINHCQWCLQMALEKMIATIKAVAEARSRELPDLTDETVRAIMDRCILGTKREKNS